MSKPLNEHKTQLEYTTECAKLIGKPSQGMLCRVEYSCVVTNNPLVIATATYQNETDKEICVIDEQGHYLVIDKEEFIAWHPVDEKSDKDELIEAVAESLLAMGACFRPKLTRSRATTMAKNLYFNGYLAKSLDKGE